MKVRDNFKITFFDTFSLARNIILGIFSEDITYSELVYFKGAVFKGPNFDVSMKLYLSEEPRDCCQHSYPVVFLHEINL